MSRIISGQDAPRGRARRPRARSSTPRSRACAPRRTRRASRSTRVRRAEPRRRARATPTRLQQVVWNLLSNAVKFTPEGRPGRGARSSGRDSQARDRGRRQRQGHRPGVPAAHLRALPAGGLVDDARRGRSRPRSRDRAPPGRAARRHGRGREPRASAQGATFTVRLPLPALRESRATSVAIPRARRRARARSTACRCWSSTTSPTRATRSPRSSRAAGATVATARGVREALAAVDARAPARRHRERHRDAGRGRLRAHARAAQRAASERRIPVLALTAYAGEPEAAAHPRSRLRRLPREADRGRRSWSPRWSGWPHPRLGSPGKPGQAASCVTGTGDYQSTREELRVR